MIMIDQPFQVGDRVAFGGEYGDITAIGLRSVRLQTLNDNTVTIPNNKFLTDMTSCGNYGALDMQVVMDFYIGLDQNVTKARDVVTEAGLTSRYVHLPKPVVVLVNQVIQDNYVPVRLRLKAYVLDTQYEKAFETDVNLRVMRAFEQHGIAPPAILYRTISGGRGMGPVRA
jgi:small-conductance mechanosensitive channel